MKLLNEIRIPKMFTAIREMRHEGRPYLETKMCLHYCDNCQQVFSAIFSSYHPGNCGWLKWRGDTYFCPSCGKLNGENFAEIHRYTRDQEAPYAPRNLTLSLQEYKEHVTVYVRGMGIGFADDGERAIFKPMKERFVFDAKKRTATFYGANGRCIELGNPYTMTDIIDHSLLGFLKKRSLAWKQNKSEIQMLLKDLREALSRKVKEFHGIELKAMSVPSGSRHGLMLFPLMNLAWRLAAPDAANLSTEFNGNDYYESYPEILKSAQDRFGDLRGPEKIDITLKLTRKGLSFPQALCQAYELPDTKAVRKLLSVQGFMFAALLSRCLTTLQNYNYGLLTYKNFIKGNTYRGFRSIFTDARYAEFLSEVKQELSPKALFILIRDREKLNLYDTLYSYYKLNKENQSAFWGQKPTPEKMHDLAAELWNKQKNKDFNLDVPEHIVKRLEMQKDTIKFFVPGTSYELKAAGRELHNCVGTYGDRVLDGSRRIVLVSDDKGKLKVCLEIDKDNNLCQAKLANNKPVSADLILNDEVISWAKKAKLTIKTNDVKVEENTTLEAAV